MSDKRRRHIVLRILLSMALLLLLCAADFPDFAKPGPPPGQLELAQGWSLVSARNVPADGAALSMPTYRCGRLARDPSNACDGSADPARGRHLPGPLLRHQSRRCPAGPLQTGLVVPHHIHRTGRPHDVHVGIPRHQLSRRNLVERPPDRGQHPNRGYAHRPRTRRYPDG